MRSRPSPRLLLALAIAALVVASPVFAQDKPEEKKAPAEPTLFQLRLSGSYADLPETSFDLASQSLHTTNATWHPTQPIHCFFFASPPNWKAYQSASFTTAFSLTGFPANWPTSLSPFQDAMASSSSPYSSMDSFRLKPGMGLP